MNRNLPLFTFLFALFAAPNVFAQIPAPAFANRYGGSGSDYNRSVRTYPDGSSIFLGEYVGSVTLAGITYTSQGNADAFLCKADPNGEVLWAQTFAGTGDQLLTQTWIDAMGNVYVVGEYSANSTFAGTSLPNSGGKKALVAKLDANGTLAWVKTATSTSNADYNEVAADAAGNVYAFGQFTDTLTAGTSTLMATGSSEDVCLVKYSPQGDVVWAKRYGNGSIDNALAIWVNPQGECTISGTFLGTLTFGTTTHTTNGSSDIFLARLNANGDPVWSKTYGGTQVDNAFALTGDAQGNVFVSGCFMQTMAVGNTTLTSNGQWDVFTAKILPGGEAEWAVSFGSSTNDRANDICLDASGNSYMFGWYQESMAVGTATLTSLGSYDVFLIKLQPNGVPVWAFSFGGTSFDVGAGMDIDAAGNLYLTGDFWSADFSVGNLNLTPTSGNDIFHIRLGTATIGIKAMAAAPPVLLRQIPAESGWLLVEAALPGRLQVVSLNGQLLYNKPVQQGQLVSLPFHGRILFYRFENEGKTEVGKWMVD